MKSFSIGRERRIGPAIPLTRLMILYQPSYVYMELTLTVIEDGFHWRDGPFHCPLKDQIREKELRSFKSWRTDNTSRTTSSPASGGRNLLQLWWSVTIESVCDAAARLLRIKTSEEKTGVRKCGFCLLPAPLCCVFVTSCVSAYLFISRMGLSLHRFNSCHVSSK